MNNAINYHKRYTKELSYELYGANAEKRETFIRDAAAAGGDPLAGLTPQPDMEHKIWRAQIKVILPLIEIERVTYITLHHGRITGVLGREYWDEAAADYRVLRSLRTGAEIADPYELDIFALRRLGLIHKRLEMLGTVSITPFFNILTDDRERLDFIADLSAKLSRLQLCSHKELERLFAGHHDFVNR
ncbi:MAG: hypothetical protein LBK56_09280 [Gracilibacteraceae bacterium]|nr:hypothetical protein [Gracilibacteraceae bacterium]